MKGLGLQEAEILYVTSFLAKVRQFNYLKGGDQDSLIHALMKCDLSGVYKH